MDTHIEERDREFVNTLQRLGTATVAELCEELSVTATSVRHRLSRLQGASVIERETVTAGRGRPVHRYRLTSGGLRALGHDYADLASLLWAELSAIEHVPTREQVLRNLREKLSSRFGVSDGTGLVERVNELARNLNEAGLDVAVQLDGELPILRGCSCPYPEISQQDVGICELETGVFSEILGADVRLRSRCVDGHTCCEFAVSEKA